MKWLGNWGGQKIWEMEIKTWCLLHPDDNQQRRIPLDGLTNQSINQSVNQFKELTIR